MSNICTICQGFGWDENFNACTAGCQPSITPHRGQRVGMVVTAAQHAAPRTGEQYGKVKPGSARNLATVKQVAYLTSLIEARDPANETVARAAKAASYGMSKAAASQYIDALRNMPTSAPQAAAGAPVRSNRYAGKCVTCGQHVAAEAGRLDKLAGKWVTYHLDGQCPAIVAPADGLDLAPLAKYSSANVARFAVPGGETRLKLRLAFKNGTVWVTDAAHYGERTTYGVQRPGVAYVGKVQDALRAVLADPIAALAAYGALTSECGVCGRPLEDAESVARGIGPVCNAKVAG